MQAWSQSTSRLAGAPANAEVHNSCTAAPAKCARHLTRPPDAPVTRNDIVQPQNLTRQAALAREDLAADEVVSVTDVERRYARPGCAGHHEASPSQSPGWRARHRAFLRPIHRTNDSLVEGLVH